MPTHAHGRQELGRSRRAREPEHRRDTPIDWAHLSRFTMNDRALEQEVLGLFAMEAPRYLGRMQSATNRKDWIEAAHTLKGSARAVGAWTIAECAQAAEVLELSTRHELGGDTAWADADIHSAPGTRQTLERLNDAVHWTLSYIAEVRASGPATSVQ